MMGKMERWRMEKKSRAWVYWISLYREKSTLEGEGLWSFPWFGLNFEDTKENSAPSFIFMQFLWSHIEGFQRQFLGVPKHASSQGVAKMSWGVEEKSWSPARRMPFAARHGKGALWPCLLRLWIEVYSFVGLYGCNQRCLCPRYASTFSPFSFLLFFRVHAFSATTSFLFFFFHPLFYFILWESWDIFCFHLLFSFYWVIYLLFLGWIGTTS